MSATVTPRGSVLPGLCLMVTVHTLQCDKQRLMYEYEYTCGFCLIYWGVRIILNIMTIQNH